jgi:hypothetical protein
MHSLEKQATVFIFDFTSAVLWFNQRCFLDLLFSPGTRENALSLTMQVEKRQAPKIGRCEMYF